MNYLFTDMFVMITARKTNGTEDDVQIFDEYKTAEIIGSCSITIPIIILLSVIFR